MLTYGSEEDQLTIITTCVNYDDFLSLTLPHMVKWGRVIVITDKQGFDTAKVAAKHGAELFTTDAWYKGESKFNKGAAINEAIADIKPKGWLLSMDADIVLLPQPLGSNSISTFDKEIMYGCPRRMCLGAAQWNNAMREGSWYDFPIDAFPPVIGGNKAKGKRARLWGTRPTANPVGVQGYFQLWHWPSHPHKMLEYHNAAMYDVELALKWEDDKRIVMPWPDYSVLHLGLRKLNWKGRETVRWDDQTTVDPIPEGDLERAAIKFHG